jgi:hypothetical protein
MNTRSPVHKLVLLSTTSLLIGLALWSTQLICSSLIYAKSVTHIRFGPLTTAIIEQVPHQHLSIRLTEGFLAYTLLWFGLGAMVWVINEVIERHKA